MQTANHPARVDVGAVGNRAGIEHHQIGFSGGRDREQSRVFERRFDRRAVRLRGAAPITLYKNFFHYCF